VLCDVFSFPTRFFRHLRFIGMMVFVSDLFPSVFVYLRGLQPSLYFTPRGDRLNTDTTAYYGYYIIGGKKYLSHQLVYIMFKNELLPQP
jgi:hypothetical protein